MPQKTDVPARGHGETVRQELTSAGGDPGGSANPARSKAKQEAEAVGLAIDFRVGRTRCAATRTPDEWPSPSLAREQNPAYRGAVVLLIALDLKLEQLISACR